MAIVAPVYCLQELVYHSNSECHHARHIPPVSQRMGTGGKVECLCCRQLNKALLRGARKKHFVLYVPA